MTAHSDRRREIQDIVNTHDDVMDRVRKLYFDSRSYAAGDKQEVEFAIKSKIARFFVVDFQNVAFCGSAQLGFSPHKDTDFLPGESDLDIAIIDARLFQQVWTELMKISHGFNYQNKFGNTSEAPIKINRIKEMLAKRAVIHLHDLPKEGEFRRYSIFLTKLSEIHSTMFSEITVSFYMNEYAFCWKQNSQIEILRR